MRTHIIGYAHTQFGRLSEVGIEDLITEVTHGALQEASCDPSEIDAVYVGHFNGGLSQQDFTAPLVLQASDALRFKPVTRVENACASGSAALAQGIRLIEGNLANRVLVIGVEKMTDCDAVGEVLLRGSYLPESRGASGFADVFSRVAQAYFDLHGDHSRALAMIASKNHVNGARNPYAHIKKPLSVDYCDTVSEQNPLVAAPLRRTDCAPISDGAAAVVLASDASVIDARWSVAVRSLDQATDFLPLSKRSLTEFEGCRRVWRNALAAARLDLGDLDFVELHDCFTIAELMQYEAMGLCAPGEGRALLEDGKVQFSGALPVNPSGGLKARGHPVGATGVSMYVMACLQLLNRAGAMQVPHATVAGIFNMGGVSVANYCSVLERAK